MRYCYSFKIINKCGDEVFSDFRNANNKRSRDAGFTQLRAWYRKRYPGHRIEAVKS